MGSDMNAISKSSTAPPRLLRGTKETSQSFIRPDGTQHTVTLLKDTTKNPLLIGIRSLFYQKVTIGKDTYYHPTPKLSKTAPDSSIQSDTELRQYFSGTGSRKPLEQSKRAKVVTETAQRHFIQMEIDAGALTTGQFLEKKYGGIKFTIIRTGDNSYSVSVRGKKLGQGSLKTAYISVPIITDKLPQVEYDTKNSGYKNTQRTTQEQLEFNNYNVIHEKLLEKQDPNVNLLLSLKKYSSPRTGKSKLVSEKCYGDLCQISSNLTDEQKLTLATEGAKVLASVHSAGYVHLDVKGENFLVKKNNKTGKPEIRLSDFEFMQKADVLGKLVGTPEFLAPEIITRAQDGHKNVVITPAMDVFSYGATLYELFPLSNDDSLLATWRFTSAESTGIENRQRQLGASNNPIHALIAKCIDVDPKKRPTMKKVEEELQNISDSKIQKISDNKRYGVRFEQQPKIQ